MLKVVVVDDDDLTLLAMILLAVMVVGVETDLMVPGVEKAFATSLCWRATKKRGNVNNFISFLKFIFLSSEEFFFYEKSEKEEEKKKSDVCDLMMKEGMSVEEPL